VRGPEVDIEDLRESLSSCMWWRVGILRERRGLEEAIEDMTRWRVFGGQLNLFGRAGFEVANLLLLGSLVATGALLREESRGTHGRRDFPELDDERMRGRFVLQANEESRFVAVEDD
jgi:succinate dehydrogenase/fumarate reductase flavoprotein subunit